MDDFQKKRLSDTARQYLEAMLAIASADAEIAAASRKRESAVQASFAAIGALKEMVPEGRKLIAFASGTVEINHGTVGLIDTIAGEEEPVGPVPTPVADVTPRTPRPVDLDAVARVRAVVAGGGDGQMPPMPPRRRSPLPVMATVREYKKNREKKQSTPTPLPGVKIEDLPDEEP